MSRKSDIAILALTFLVQVTHSKVVVAEMLASYEISAEVMGNSTVIRTSKPVEFGKPLTHEFGEYQIRMLFQSVEQDQFIVSTSLNSIRPTTNEVVYTMLSENFEGQISSNENLSQTAFAIEDNGISFSVVLRLSEMPD